MNPTFKTTRGPDHMAVSGFTRPHVPGIAMKKSLLGVFASLLFAIAGQGKAMADSKTIALPAPKLSGDLSVEEALQKRRSVRNYRDAALSLAEIGQLAWAAQGITGGNRGYRTAPSAGATFPIEIYFLLTGMDDVPDGVYRYGNRDHRLVKVLPGDKRRDVFQAALRQEAIINAPVVMVITGVVERTAARYGERAPRFVYLEAGHVAQNVCLQAVGLDIGTVVIGAFDDDGIKRALQLAENESPLYLMPLGKLPDNS